MLRRTPTAFATLSLMASSDVRVAAGMALHQDDGSGGRCDYDCSASRARRDSSETSSARAPVRSGRCFVRYASGYAPCRVRSRGPAVGKRPDTKIGAEEGDCCCCLHARGEAAETCRPPVGRSVPGSNTTAQTLADANGRALKPEANLESTARVRIRRTRRQTIAKRRSTRRAACWTRPRTSCVTASFGGAHPLPLVMHLAQSVHAHGRRPSLHLQHAQQQRSSLHIPR